jgi:ureidoacrylate peracid hydrolase
LVPEKNVKWTFGRENSVLIVVDMQNDFILDGGALAFSAAKDIVPKVRTLIDKCRALSVPVISTVHATDASLHPMEIAAFPHLRDGGLRRGTHGVEIIDDLAPAAGDRVITKRRFSAFYQTDLELILRNLRASTVIICGVASNICCESTARDAMFRDFKVVFGSDVCAAFSPEAHDATLANMEIFGRVMDSGTILRSLTDGKG